MYKHASVFFRGEKDTRSEMPGFQTWNFPREKGDRNKMEWAMFSNAGNSENPPFSSGEAHMAPAILFSSWCIALSDLWSLKYSFSELDF